MLKPSPQECSEGGGKKERQPAGGGKTKGKVKESRRGRGEVGEDRGGETGGGWGRK